MNPSRILVPVLLLAGLSAGSYWLFIKSDETVARPDPVQEQPAKPPTVDPQAPPPKAAGTTPTVEPVRQEPERVAAVNDNTNDSAPQGVKGRVLLPGGQPAAGVPIYLIEGMMNDPIKVFLMSKSGNTPPPISSGTTATDGTFALGVLQPGKSYDLRVASDSHPEVNHQSIKVRDEDWYDTGDLKLEQGLTITGRVIDEITKAGIPGAMVYLSSSNQASTMLPTPGRERGIAAMTDGTGGFRIASAPTKGMVNLTAEAEGYAAARLDNQQVDKVGNVLLEISKGQPIAGVVVDTEGEPLSGIKVVALGMSQKTPQTETTTTGRDGVFQFASLREGPYEITANSGSNAYAESKTPPVITGDLDVKVVMVLRPWVKLRVTGSRGQTVKNYKISLKRYFPNNPLGIGNVPEFRDRRINPGDYPADLGGEWAVVRGVPAGDYVFQIEERTHAKSLSESFTVREGAEPVEVSAQLTLGAAITGTVVDDLGKPVAGALVSTDMNNAFQGDGGIFELFRSMIPERHSKAQERTNARGQFRFDKLAFAEYMIRVGHPDYCEGRALNITLSEEGQVVDVGTVQLARGTIVEGYTTVTGQAAGQVKVTLTIPPAEAGAGKPGGKVPGSNAPGNNEAPSLAHMFSASVISDNSGRYRLLKRVPPGRYKVTASRASGENNPFMILLDMRESERFVTLEPGMDRIKLDFDLPAR